MSEVVEGLVNNKLQECIYLWGVGNVNVLFLQSRFKRDFSPH